MAFIDCAKAALRGMIAGPTSEVITYFPGGVIADPRSIRAIVQRHDRESEADLGGYTSRADLLIARDSILGVATVDVKKDLADIVLEVGQVAQRVRVNRIFQDGTTDAWWHLGVMTR